MASAGAEVSGERYWCRGRPSALVSALSQHPQEIDAALELDPGNPLEVRQGARRLVHHELVLRLGEGNESGDGRLAITDDHGVTTPDPREVLAEMGFELGNLGLPHGHI